MNWSMRRRRPGSKPGAEAIAAFWAQRPAGAITTHAIAEGTHRITSSSVFPCAEAPAPSCGKGKRESLIPHSQRQRPGEQQGCAADQECVDRLIVEDAPNDESEERGRHDLRDHNEEIEDPHVVAEFRWREGPGKDRVGH